MIRKLRKTKHLFLEQGKPLVFGATEDKGIKFDGFEPVIVDLKNNNVSVSDLWIHDEKDKIKANILAGFADHKIEKGHLPRPFGVLYSTERPTYESIMSEQIEQVTAKKGKPSLNKILSGDKTWEIA